MPTFNFKLGDKSYRVKAAEGVSAEDALGLVSAQISPPAEDIPPLNTDIEVQEPAADEPSMQNLPSISPKALQRAANFRVEPSDIAEAAAQYPAQVGAQALDAGRAANADPQDYLDRPEDTQKEALQRTYVHALNSSPELRAYAERSPAHASAVQDDAGPLAKLSHWLAGRFDGVEQWVRQVSWGQKPQEIQYTPPIALQALERGTKGAYAQIAESLQLISEMTGNKSLAPLPEQLEQARQWQKENAKPIGGAEAGVGKVVASSIEAVPGLAALLLAPEAEVPAAAGAIARFAAKAAAPSAILAFQNVGTRYQEIKAQGVYTDEQAQALAASSSMLGAVAGSLFASKFVGGLLPAGLGKAGNAAFGRGIADLFASRGLLAQAGGMAGHAYHAFMFNYGMQMSEGAAEFASKRLATGEWDPSILSASWQKTKEGTINLLPLVLAPGAARIANISVDRIGKWVSAHGERAELEGMHEEVSSVKQVPPSEMVDLLDTMLANNTDRQTVYIDAKKFASVAEANKRKPEALSDQYERTSATGVVPMKTSHFLLLDPKVREAMLDHTKFTPDGFNFNEAKKIETIGEDLYLMRDWEAWANEEQPPPGSPQRKEAAPPKIKSPVDLKLGPAAMKQQANEYVQGRPIGLLATNQKLYEQQARRAQGDMDQSQLQALNRMSEAHQKAQEGVQKGREGIEAAQWAADAQASAVEVEHQRVRLQGFMDQRAALEKKVRDALADSAYDPESSDQQYLELVRRDKLEARAELDRKLKVVKEQQRMAESDYKLATKKQKEAEAKSVTASGKEIKAGEKSAQADEAQAQRDASAALADAHRRAAKQAGKISAQLEKLSKNADPFEASAAEEAGPEYRDAFAAAMSHLGFGEAREPIDAKPLYERMASEGWTDKTVQFDMPAFADWLANPKPLESLTLPQAKNVLDAIKTMRKAVSGFNKLQVGEKTQLRSEWISDAKRELERRGLEGGQFTHGEKDSLLKRWRAEKTSPAVLMEPFGESGRKRVDAFYDARNTESNINHETVAKFQEIFFDRLEADLRAAHAEMGAGFNGIDSWSESKLPMLAVDPKANPRLAHLPKTIPRKDMWGMAIQSGNESGMQKMARGYGVEPVDIATYLNQNMLKAEWDAVSRIHRHNDKLFDLVSKVEEAKTGVAPEALKKRVISTPHGDYEGGYSPFRWFDSKSGLPENVSDTDAYRGAFEGLDTKTGAIEERQDAYHSVPDIRWDMLPDHYKQLTHHIAFSEYVRQNYALMNDPSFKNLVQDKLGDAHYQALSEAHDMAALGNKGLEVRAKNVAASILRQGMGIAARSIFNYNLPIQLGQYGHALTAGMAFGANPNQVREGYIASLIPEARAQALRESSSLRYRAQDYISKVIEQEETIGGFKSNRFLNLIDKPGRTYMAFQDGQIAHAMYETAKLKALADGADSQEAITHANRVVNLGMPKLNAMEQAAFVRDHGAVGLVQLVRNYPNEITNMKAINDWNTRAGIGDGGSRFAMYGGRALQGLAIAGSLAVTHYAMGHGRNEHEVKEGTLGTMKFVLRSLIESKFYGDPFLHPIAQAVTPLALGEGFHSKGINLLGVPVVDMVNDIGKKALAFAEDPSKEKAYVAAIGAAGKLLFGAHPIRLLEADEKLRQGGSTRFSVSNDPAALGLRLYGDRYHTNPGFDLGDMQ